ncbi:MAG: HD domain-containing protein [Lachnospiraceae bacterium]|nr:HD domain-containing protein [Lachnospiraceae bacterium]
MGISGIEIYYVSIFWISLALSGVYFYMWHRHFSVNFTLIFAFVPVVNLGYILREQAKTLEGYIISQKIIYFGGCFLLLFIMLNIFDMCKVKLPKKIKLFFLLCSVVIFLFVLTIGEGHLFYKKINGSMTDSGFEVIKTYGPVHAVFYAVIVMYSVLSFAAIYWAALVKKSISQRIILFLFLPEMASVICFFSTKFIVSGLELVPASYAFAQLMYVYIAHRLCLYDVSETAVDSIAETGATGFVSFDMGLNFLGANQTAEEIFEDISKLEVDRGMDVVPAIGELFGPWVESFKNDEKQDKFYYEKDDSIYLVDINYLYDDGKKKGYQFIITDDTKNQKYIKLIDSYNADLEEEVKEKTADIVRMHNDLIRSMAMMVESRDNSTGGHIIRTSDVVEMIMDRIMKDEKFVKEFGLTEKFKENIIKVAPLHDIGKIAVDDAILRKPGRYNDEEFAKMKKHAAEGAKVLHRILENSDDEDIKALAENVAHYHHERMDGSGYPEGLSGDAIPIEARIMAVADVYDALVSKRVYKDSMSFEKADAIMMESFGKHFDKRLEKYYVAARPAIEKYYTKANELSDQKN